MSLAGIWTNEYGSEMELQVFGPLVYGFYRSSTGSTGEYELIGYAQPNDPTANAGQAMSIAIEWHSISGGQGDPSWHWCSGLSGQVSLESGVETMVLLHAMVATDPFPGLAQPGVYIDKLTYTRKVDASPRSGLAAPETCTPLADPLTGTWKAADGTVLSLMVYPGTGNAFGWVIGTLTSPQGAQTEISGVTDINATSSGLKLQSVAITSLTGGAQFAVSLAGMLDLSSSVLSLYQYNSQSTAPDATYVQTILGFNKFSR